MGTKADLILDLQRVAGNKAVTRWLQREADVKPAAATAGAAGAKAHMQRGVELLHAHKFDEAVEAFREAYRLHPSHRILLNEGSALFDGGRYGEAIIVYKRYLADPGAERKPEARKQIARARKAIPGQARSDFDEGQARYIEGDYDGALLRFERAYAGMPHPGFLFNQASSLHKMGRYETASDRYEMYLRDAPAATDAARVRTAIDTIRSQPIPLGGRVGAEEYMKRGARLLRAKWYVPAIGAFDEAYRTFPNHKALLNKASALLDSGRWAEAILAYERYLADPAVTGGDDSRVNEVHEAIARARKRMGGREVSITNVDAAQRWLRKGVTRYEASNYAGALEAFDRSYDLHPLADLRYNQAACLDKMGKRLVAANRYEMYLDEKPDAADAKRVRDHITKLRTEARDAGRSAFDEAQLMYLEGRYAEAAELFLRAFEHTGISDLLYNHAKALDMAQDKMKAVRAYAKYLQLVPQGPNSEKVRARMRILQQETGSELMVP